MTGAQDDVVVRLGAGRWRLVESGDMTTVAPTSSPTVWAKARDTLIVAAPKGREMPDGQTVDAEAGLIFTVEGVGPVVIEGSLNRLLKTLDYARASLLDSAPELIEVEEGVPGEASYSYRLRCPHCGYTAADGEDVVFVVEVGERVNRFALEAGEVDDVAVVAGAYKGGSYGTEHHRCVSCDRPVKLPVNVEEVGD